MNKVETVKVGLVGLGYWGPNLLRNLLVTPGVKVVACADLDEKRLFSVKQTRPEIILYQDYRRLLTKDLNAVVIATPPSTHFRIASDSLKAGKHVLVEKPLTTSYQDALTLIQLAKKQQRILMVDHIFIYAKPIVKIKEYIDKKELGEIFYFDSTRINLGLFQNDTNVLWDLACHDLSILDYLLPERPISLTCIGESHTGNRQVDIVYMTLRYKSSLLSHINVNWLAPTKVRRITIGGSKKMVVYDEGNVEERVKIYDKRVETKGDARKTALVNYRVGEVVSPFVPADEALAQVCRHFSQCIRRRLTPITDGWSGARIVKLLELGERAMKAGKPMSIPHIRQIPS